jgi:hypothetical protein
MRKRTWVVAALAATFLAGCNSEESSLAGPTTSAGDSNALLSGLTTSAGALTPGFVASHQTYTILVRDMDSITVTARSNNSAAISIKGPGLPASGASLAPGAPSPAIPLAMGENLIEIVSRSKDGTVSVEYTITAKRMS